MIFGIFLPASEPVESESTKTDIAREMAEFSPPSNGSAFIVMGTLPRAAGLRLEIKDYIAYLSLFKALYDIQIL
jgi:hypothetical protein